MAFMLARFEVGDYDAWKQMFDSDPAGRKQAATGHRLYRSVSTPSEVFVAVEFASQDEAASFRERLLASGVLDNLTVKTEPTLVEETEAVTY